MPSRVQAYHEAKEWHTKLYPIIGTPSETFVLLIVGLKTTVGLQAVALVRVLVRAFFVGSAP
jgi:hypothetical protein